MKKTKRRRFSADFKQEAVRLSEISDKGVSQLERELGLSRGQLSHWRRLYARYGTGAFEKQARTPEAQELARLRSEVVRLREERDILKKVLSMFSASE